MKRTLFLLMATATLFSHCKPEEKKVSKEEVPKFVFELESGAVKRRPDLITSRVLIQALSDRMQKEKTIKHMAGISEGLKQSLRYSELEKNIYSILGKNGSFEKVKTYEKDGAQRVLFRIYGDNGLNYLDMELTKLEDKVGIADMFVYLSGENISKSMAEIAGSLMNGVSQSTAEKHASALQSIKKLMANENYTQAKKEFDKLPLSIKNTRIAQIINIQIASNLEEETFIKELTQFEIKYSGEPSMQLSMINLYFMQKDYDKALQSINTLDSFINKDPFLDYYRGLIYNAKGDTEKAVDFFKKTTSASPTLADPYIHLTDYYLTKNDRLNAKLYFSKYKNMRNANETTIRSYEMLYPILKG